MTPVTVFAGKSVAVFGLGGSGLVSAEALRAGGASVIAWDDGEAGRESAREKGLAVADLRDADWSRFAALVLSPGVPLTHPEPHWSVPLARAAGVEIIGDIELFCRERARLAPAAPFVAVTATNGKSTTTALIAHILREAGRDVAMGGNIGTPILALDPPAADRIHVIECSSFQIDLAPSLNPSIGVLLNITPDHLDRHGTMDHYAAIKERLVAHADAAVIAVDDPLARLVAERLAGAGRALVPVSAAEPPGDASLPAFLFARGTAIFRAGDGAPVADLAGIGTLRGRHNAQNAVAAVAAASRLGIDDAAIAAALHTFPGLPHRLEEIARQGRVLFVNDSKATNADSAAKALASFPGGIFWILGGKAKEGGIAALNPFFAKIEKAYLIGEASDAFAASLEGEVPYERCGQLDNAVAGAARDAMRSPAPEPVVLLSPAAASYDQFPNFEVRGNHFRQLVASRLAAEST